MTRAVICAVLVFVIQWQPKRTDTHSDTAKSQSAHEPADSLPPSAHETGVVVINQQTPKRQTDRPTGESQSYFKRLLSPETAPTVILCVVGITGVVIAICSLTAIKRQVSVMRRQVDLTFGQLRAMHEQITEMSAQTDVLRESVKAAQAGATAAQSSADFLAISERAWITVSPAEFEVREFFPTKFVFDIKNAGKTPAQIIEVQSIYKKWLRIDNLPEIPDFDGFQPQPFHSLILTPEDALQLTSELSNCNDYSAENVSAIKEGRRFLLSFGYVRYRDAFGKERITRFCFVYKYTEGYRVSIHRFERYFDAPVGYTQSD